MSAKKPGRTTHPLAAVAGLADFAFDEPAEPLLKTPSVKSPGSQISDASLAIEGDRECLDDLPPLIADLQIPSEFPQRSQSDMLVSSHSRFDTSSIASLSSPNQMNHDPSASFSSSSGSRGSCEAGDSPRRSRRMIKSDTLFFEPSVDSDGGGSSITPTTVSSIASGSRGSGTGSSGMIKKSVTTIGDSFLAPQSLESSLLASEPPVISEPRPSQATMTRRSGTRPPSAGALSSDEHRPLPPELSSRTSLAEAQRRRRTRRMEHRQVLVGLCQENDYLWKVIRGKDEIISDLKRQMEAKDRILEDYEKRERESIRRMQSLSTAPVAGVSTTSATATASVSSATTTTSSVAVAAPTSANVATIQSDPSQHSTRLLPSGLVLGGAVAVSSGVVSSSDATVTELATPLHPASSQTSLTPTRSSGTSSDPSPEPRHLSDSMDQRHHQSLSQQRRSSPMVGIQAPSHMASQMSVASEVSASTEASVPMTPHLPAATEVCRVRDGKSWLNDKYLDFRQVSGLVHRGDTSLFEASLGKVMIKRIPRRKLGCATKSSVRSSTAPPESYAQEDPMMEIELTKTLSAMRPDLLASLAGSDESLGWMVSALNNFIKPYDLMSDDQWYWVAAPFIRGGDLNKVISDNPRIHLLTIKDYAKQMVTAVHFLHEFCGFVHLDITPDNFLLDDSNGLIKLIDFGAARYIPDFEERKNASFVIGPPGSSSALYAWSDVSLDSISSRKVSEKMTKSTINSTRMITRLTAPFPAPKKFTQPGKPAYRSPELHLCQQFDGISTDIWSLGVSIFTLLAGHNPWKSPDLDKDEYFAKMFAEFVHFTEDRRESKKKKQSELLLSKPRSDSSSESHTAQYSDEIVGRVSGEGLSATITCVTPTIESVVRSRNRDHFTPLCTDLLNSMLCFDAEDRMDLSSVLSHDWFTTMEESEMKAVSECDTEALLSGEIRLDSAITSGTEPSDGLPRDEELRGLDSTSEDESSEGEIGGLDPDTLEHLRRLGYEPSPAVTASRTPSLSTSDLLSKLGGESPGPLDLNHDS